MNEQREVVNTYQAVLEVEPRGYWFSAGGEKGAFGYYPHLRDARGLPVYPDTQVHGDLKMAARWLVALDGAKADLVDYLFGTGGGDEHGRVSRPSRLFTGDLSLDDTTGKKWRAERFEVKPRIKIDAATRTVEKHFLVDLEMARLDGLRLRAPVFLAVPGTKLDAAAALLNRAVQLLSGFGAFRSRGYGRGRVFISEFADYKKSLSGPKSCESGVPYRYSLAALVNVRNKAVDPGNAQVIYTDSAITSEQLKGWLAQIYCENFGAWPEPGRLAAVKISSLYPAPSREVLAFPPPMSTLMNVDGKVMDTWGAGREVSSSPENFFQGKVKPLTGHTVTEDGRIHPVTGAARVRNAMDDGFTTIQNGLFVQEFLPAGTIFTGTVEFGEGLPDEFREQISGLLARSVLRLKGALLAPEIGESCPRYGAAAGKPELLTEPRPFQIAMKSGGNAVNIATRRTYNTVCRRPRRGRVVVMPGSILVAAAAESGEKTWIGFTDDHRVLDAGRSDAVNERGDGASDSNRQRRTKDYVIALDEKQKGAIGKAQAGVLRTLLHPALTTAVIRQMLDHRIEKYKAKDRERELCRLLDELLVILNLEDRDRGGLEAMRTALREVLEQLALARWELKSNAAKEEGRNR